MANPEHIAAIQRGVVHWNRWRRDNPGIKPDLREAKLGGKILSEVNLSGADLRGANLIDTALIYADLTRAQAKGVYMRIANLKGADLSEANLDYANLMTATLTEARLDKASLVHANLKDARIYSASLTQADLSDAVLDSASLTNSDLADCNLQRTSLTRADLSKARLCQADFYGANLSVARLTDADLTDAYLARTYLGRADLQRAILTGATIRETVFGDTDLRNTRGLDACDHLGPSTIDHRTLERSTNLPLSFLRGCGLPDTLIDYLPSLQQAKERHSCFISYSAADEEFAQRLYADLQDAGIRCWYAPADMKIGDGIRKSIDEMIRTHDKLLLILSKSSMGSIWVEKEVETAIEKERLAEKATLFPIRLDDTVLDRHVGWAADIRRSRHIGDFTAWREQEAYQCSVNRLLRDLKVSERTND